MTAASAESRLPGLMSRQPCWCMVWATMPIPGATSSHLWPGPGGWSRWICRASPAATLPRSLSPPIFRDVLLSLLDTLSIPRATLIGHSLGAMLCQYLAFEQPERVRGLILLGGTVITRHQKITRELLLYLLPVIGDWQYNRLRKDPHKAYETLRPYYADLDSLPEAERSFLFERVNQRVWSDTQRAAFLSTLRSWLAGCPSQRRLWKKRWLPPPPRP